MPFLLIHIDIYNVSILLSGIERRDLFGNYFFSIKNV